MMAGASPSRPDEGRRPSEAERPGAGKRILFLCPYPPGSAASQRFRFEQYLPALRAAGFEVTQASFWDDATWKILYKPGHRLAKAKGALAGFYRRLETALDSRGYDYVFIHLEATPVGPPIVEALLLLLRRKIVYDIDDSIFLPRESKAHPLISKFRFTSKVPFVARHCYRVSAVNPFIREWAEALNPSVTWVPTTIDPTYHRPIPALKKREPGPVVLGWTGTHSTAPYLDLIRPALKELGKTHDFRLRVICNQDPGFPEVARYEFVPWREATEIEDLHAIDVGLMPVPDTLWARGKVGFKAIQYSALEIPTISSDVGSAREVIEDGVTGLVVRNEPAAWLAGLKRMLDDGPLRRAMGQAARPHVLARYSIPAQTPTYIGLFS